MTISYLKRLLQSGDVIWHSFFIILKAFEKSWAASVHLPGSRQVRSACTVEANVCLSSVDSRAYSLAAFPHMWPARCITFPHQTIGSIVLLSLVLAASHQSRLLDHFHDRGQQVGSYLCTLGYHHVLQTVGKPLATGCVHICWYLQLTKAIPLFHATTKFIL